jgi:hypothetical protein
LTTMSVNMIRVSQVPKGKNFFIDVMRDCGNCQDLPKWKQLKIVNANAKQATGYIKISVWPI